MQPMCPSTGEWIKKMWYIYIYNGILLSHKKEWNLATATTLMDLEGIMRNEIRQRKTTMVWFHLYVESKKQNKWTNITKQKQTHRYREQASGCQRGEGWGEGQNRWRGLRGTNCQL